MALRTSGHLTAGLGQEFLGYALTSLRSLTLDPQRLIVYLVVNIACFRKGVSIKARPLPGRSPSSGR